MSKHNITTGQTVATTAAYVEITAHGVVEELFGMYANGGEVYLSVGHTVPADATSILVKGNGSWGIDEGISGKVFVRGVSSDITVHSYGA